MKNEERKFAEEIIKEYPDCFFAVKDDKGHVNMRPWANCPFCGASLEGVGAWDACPECGAT